MKIIFSARGDKVSLIVLILFKKKEENRSTSELSDS